MSVRAVVCGRSLHARARATGLRTVPQKSSRHVEDEDRRLLAKGLVRSEHEDNIMTDWFAVDLNAARSGPRAGMGALRTAGDPNPGGARAGDSRIGQCLPQLVRHQVAE